MDYLVVYLPHYLLLLISVALYTCVCAFVAPDRLRDQIYLSGAGVTSAGMRLYAPWLFITTCIRTRAYLHFGDQAWYDATMITLAAAQAHWVAEFFIHGSISTQQFVAAMGIDGVGFGWMWMAREAVTA